MIAPFSIVNQIVNAAKMTDVKNKIIKSPSVAIIDVKKDVWYDSKASNAGIVALTLPKEKQLSKGLLNCELGSGDEKDDTVLLVSIHIRLMGKSQKISEFVRYNLINQNVSKTSI